MRVAVIGAGVIGASVTYHLAKRGVEVHCFDRATTAGSGTTSVGFATATAYRRFPQAYFALNQAGIAEHVKLGGQWWHQSGTIGWSDDESFGGYLDLLAEWGCDVERRSVHAAHRELERSVDFPRSGVVARLPREGWIDAVAFTQWMLSVDGASVRLGTAVEKLDKVDSGTFGVLSSDGTRTEVDAVVNAAGSGADDVAVMAGARRFLGAPRRSLIIHVDIDHDLKHIVRAPDISIRPDGPGRIVMRSDQVDRKLPDRSGAPEPTLVDDLLARAHRVIPTLSAGTIHLAHVVDARCPRDDLPSAGALTAVPGYYEAVASAGVTLAPLFGRLLAEQMTNGTVDALLKPFSPDRFSVQ
ncbi:NAD(P)/FAD-dependent oxidoreductase [Actinocrispum wychmicini]|uniref:Glycine/D-amino acid oxidase-like deaminating enzyme n=1 Tax=Actinocrispum wychmicini TaxID=1213861 RepID=A0A4R2JRT1_9PSEU|nr:FAD-binding oxidoreductase [Actinocrispum wychmicini]TCO59916.1 glycine/D-amino acid oxidase-like deaminating enzyme [Actinocrispum wychmicini]